MFILINCFQLSNALTQAINYFIDNDIIIFYKKIIKNSYKK